MAKKMKWSDPRLVELGGTERTAHGDCVGGSVNISVCIDGNFAASCESVGNQELPPPP